MRGLNKCTFIGVCGKDPEVKYTSNNKAVAKFSIAINESRKKGDSYEDYTEWVQLVMFGKVAEVANKYLHKGSKIYVEGRLQTSSWEDQSGSRRFKSEIAVNLLLMLDKKEINGSDGGYSKPAANPTDDDRYSDKMNGEDLPF